MSLSVKEVAEKWEISERRVRVLCEEGKIPGAEKVGRSWRIPASAHKPMDGRSRKVEALEKSIEGYKAYIDSCRPLTEGELRRLSDGFAIRFTYNSNAIEGSTLTERETDLALRGLTVDKKPLRDHLDAIGHRDAFEYTKELAKDGEPLSVLDIRRIHELVLAADPEDAGVFRRIPVKIVGALHTPPSPTDVPSMLEALLTQYSESAEGLLESMARFHLEFEAIHPFIDGNGRCGRLIMNLELMKKGYVPIDIRYTQRAAYYDAFDAYHSGKGVRAMAELIGEALEAEMAYRAMVLGSS